MYPGKDPYFANYYRINFDGTGLTRLTDADANHIAAFSSDMRTTAIGGDAVPRSGWPRSGCVRTISTPLMPGFISAHTIFPNLQISTMARIWC